MNTFYQACSSLKLLREIEQALYNLRKAYVARYTVCISPRNLCITSCGYEDMGP